MADVSMRPERCVRYLSGKPLKAASRDKAESLITGLKSLATMAQKKEEEALMVVIEVTFTAGYA